jgi:hypothetical protein
MLSKSKGQILRVAATLHVLFNIHQPGVISEEISNPAIEAAINLIDVCIQHAAYLAGRGDVLVRIEELLKGKLPISGRCDLTCSAEEVGCVTFVWLISNV